LGGEKMFDLMVWFSGTSVRLIFVGKILKMLEIAYLSFKKSKIFWGLGMPPDPSRGSHLRWSTRLSQNLSYGMICCPMTYVYLLFKPCIYTICCRGSCSDTVLPTGTSPGPPLNMSPPVTHP
jgi:hypothetical protein